MLSVLHIENIAVIEQADIVFNQGFNVLTGETGAGKSIVIDAISAILGERAYRDMVRTGAAKASVRALFRQVPELPWFQENGVPYEEETLIQREIYLDGKNVCRVNGQERQRSNTREMLFTPAAVLYYVSQYITLEAGDVLFTGTPGGVMQGRPPEEQHWLRPGDVVEVTIDGIGTLQNRFV